MPNLIDCLGLILGRGDKHSDGSAVLNAHDRESLLNKAGEYAKVGHSALEAGQMSVRSHLDEVHGQLKSVWEQAGERRDIAQEQARQYWSNQTLEKLQQVKKYYTERVNDSPQRTATLAMLDEIIAGKKVEPVAGPQPKPAPKKKGGFQKQEEPDDLISFIRDNIGKIRTKASAGESSQAYYEGNYKESLKHGAIKKLYSNAPTAQTLDNVADVLRRARRVPEDFSAGDLHDLLIADAQARKGEKRAATAEDKSVGREEAQRIDFESTLLKGKRETSEKAGVQPINVNDLFEGDTFEMAGEKVTVKELRLDPESGDLAYVVLEDGRRFGTQTVGSDTVIHPDEGTLVQKEPSTEFLEPEPSKPPESTPGPKLRRGENQGDVFANQTEDLTLAGEKATDHARIEAEKEAAAKASAEAKAAQDKAQGDLLRPGPGAQTIGAAAKSELEQLTDVVRGMEKSNIPWREQFKMSLDATMAKAKDIWEASLAGSKGAYAYLKNKLVGSPGFTEWKRGVSRWDAEDQLSSRAAYFFAKETAKTIPQPARQAAISKWVDAGGDMATLQTGEAATTAQFKQAYRDAQNLSPEELNLARNIQNYFDAKLQDAIDSGLLEAGLDNYIHRIYPKESTSQAKALSNINAGTLQPNPGLIRKRLFQFDYEAEAAGHKPVQGFADRILAYDQAFNRALSARSFIKWLQSTHKEADGRPSVDVAGMGKVLEDPVTGDRQGVLINPHYKTKGLAPGATPAEIALNNRADYVAYDHPALRKWKWVAEDADGKPIMVQGDLLVHKDRVRKLDALLGKSWWQQNKIARAVLKTGFVVKQTMLDLSLFHPVQIKFHSLEHRVTKLREIDFTEPDQRALVDHALVIFDHRAQQMFSEGLAAGHGSLFSHLPLAGAKLNQVHDFVFKEWIPKVKMTMAIDALERNRERFRSKLSEDDILYLTAKQSNAAFGFQNYRDLGMHPTMQDTLRALLLAPDFLMSRAAFVGQAFTKHSGWGAGFKGEQLEALALGAVGLFVLARIGNQISTQEWQWDKPFEVVIGGRSFGIRSVQEDLYNSIKDTRKFIYGRINPVTTRTAVEALTGRDYRGVKRTGLEQAADLAKTPVPISFKTDDQKKLWESFIAAMGVTVKRASAVQEILQLAKKWKDKQGIVEPGEFIYDPDKDPYRKLKIALSLGDESDARAALADLKKDPALTDKVSRHMTKFYNQSFSGAKSREADFKESLSADKQKLYDDALREKAASLELFRKIDE